MKTKVEIRVNIKPNSHTIAYKPYLTWKNENTGRKNGESICEQFAAHKTTNSKTYTDFLTAVINELKYSITKTALVMIYCHCQHPVIWDMISDLSIINKQEQKDAVHEQLLMDENELFAYDEFRTLEKQRTKKGHHTQRYYREIEYAKSGALSYAKQKTKRMITDDNGKRHAIPIIPKTEIVDTVYAKTLLNNDNIQILNSNVEDVLQICLMAYIELANNGFLNCVSDVWNYRYYAYRKINNYIYSVKRHDTQKTSLYTVDDSGEEVYINIRDAYDYFQDVEMSLIYDDFEMLLLQNLDKRCNKDNILIACRLKILYGYTDQHISGILHVHKSTVTNYIRIAYKVAAGAPAIYNALHGLIG